MPNPTTQSSPIILSLFLLGSLTACEGALGSHSPDGTQAGENPTTEGPGPGPGLDENGNCVDLELCEGSSTPLLHLSRLTHAQWGNSVGDIFELGEVPVEAGTFVQDSVSSRFSTANQDLKVYDTLWLDYERAAESIANQVASTESLDRLAPARDRDHLLQTLGRRCYRRPLSADELAQYQALFDSGAQLLASGDDFADGVAMFARSCLQSPHFLYRTELTDGTLDSYALVSRLTLSLWETSPSDELLDLAASGDLEDPDEVRSLIDSMLADPRSRQVLRSFHSELLHLDAYADMVKDPGRYPHFNENTPDYLVEETQLFLEDLVFDSSGTYGDVLTAPFTYVNEELAVTYGLDGAFGPEFVRVDLDPNERAGLLTHLGFLTKNGDAFDQDPIHRGVSTAIDIACSNVPPPPANIETPDRMATVTIREYTDEITSAPACASCHHSFINPAGFAFGNYDGDGSYITMDAGLSIDSSGEFPLDDGTIQYDDAIEFSEGLANSPQVHRCYSGNLLQFYYGRDLTDGDQPMLQEIAMSSVAGELAIRDLIRELLLSDYFLSRLPLD